MWTSGTDGDGGYSGDNDGGDGRRCSSSRRILILRVEVVVAVVLAVGMVIYAVVVAVVLMFVVYVVVEW